MRSTAKVRAAGPDTPLSCGPEGSSNPFQIAATSAMAAKTSHAVRQDAPAQRATGGQHTGARPGEEHTGRE